jgi:hypothetical protein
MKIEILTTPKAIEATNVVLARAIESLIENQNVTKQFGLDAEDIALVERFRMRMVKSYLKK